ncbi:hypothetical protein [Nocardia takedensis]|uniref:hypothetical protein n=1 Tax=Nocardia takedensis TaxID=259390 RepID=UPI00031B276C|nr:hypothetical protein [Nocardia takedensis]
MSTTTKTLLFVGIALGAVIVGLGAGILAEVDGATLAAAIRAGVIGFGATLTLALAALVAYKTL